MLNVYKCSGVVGRVDDVDGSKYQYYTGLTNEASNTVAFNYLLARINSLIVKYPYLDAKNQIDTLNDIDVIAVALEGLTLLKEHPDKYDITLIGSIISSMIADGKFEATFTDDERRAANLDALIADFTDCLVNGVATTQDADFTVFWVQNIEPYNYNSVTDAELNRYNELITDSNKVGANDRQTLGQYMTDSGPGFLYMFIPDEDVKKYNTTIRFKRDIEIDKNFDYIRRTTYGMYNDAAIIEQFETGIWLEYKMSPEQKLQELLDNGGKVGELITWLTAISIIIGILGALFGLIMEIFKVTYEIPDGYDGGVPSDEDLNEMLANSPKTTEKSNKWWLLGGLGILGLLFYK